MKPLKLLTIIIFLSNHLSYSQLSGTKIVGPAPSDFLTLTTAINTLNEIGINGDLIFEIKNGVYNEPIIINNFSNNNTSSVTIRPYLGQNVVLQSNGLNSASNDSLSDNYIIKLNSCSNVVIDGIVFNPQDTQFGICIKLADNSSTSYDNIKIRNCTFNGNSDFVTELGSIIHGSNSKINNWNIENCNFNNAKYGIKLLPPPNGVGISNSKNIIIRYNSFLLNSPNALYSSAVVLQNIDNFRFLNNKVFNYQNGLNLKDTGGNNKISKNTFSGGGETNQFGAIYIKNGLTQFTEISSNMILIIAGAANSGGLQLYNNINYKIIHNTVHSRSINVTSFRADYIENTDIMNNIFTNFGGGLSFYYNTTGTVVYDYNCNLSLNGSYNKLKIMAPNYGLHNILLNPQYISDNDLHCQQNSPVKNAGKALDIGTDIDEEIRKLFLPDIGADEISPQCTPTASLTSNIAGIFQYKTNNTIQSTQKIDNFPSSRITYDTKNAIILNPGFEVNSTNGTVFSTNFFGCD